MTSPPKDRQDGAEPRKCAGCDLPNGCPEYCRCALVEQPSALTPEIVEDRLNAWRQRLMNKSGDRLALDDFMGQESIDDLIDFVCAPVAAHPVRESPAEPVRPLVFLIHFDDRDRSPEIITDEAAARERYRRISGQWNAHLFVKVDSNTRDDPYANFNLPLGESPATTFEAWAKANGFGQSMATTWARQGWDAALASQGAPAPRSDE